MASILPMLEGLHTPRHFHRFAALLLLIMLARGIMLLCVVPALEGWDEYQHLAYIDYLITTGETPIVGQSHIPPEFARRAAAYPQSDFAAGQLQTWGAHSYRDYWRDGPAKVTDGQPIDLYQAQHPPLYYWLMVPIYRLAGGADHLPRAAFACRSVNLLFMLLAAWFFLLALRELAGDAHWWIAAAAILAVHPLFLFNGLRVASDGLSVAAAGLVLWLMARQMRALAGQRPWDWREIAALGLATGLLIWTKSTVLAYAPAVMLLPLLWGWRSAGSATWPRRLAMLLLLAITAALIAGPYLLHNLHQYGTVLPLAEMVHNQQHGHLSLADSAHAALQVPWLGELRKWFGRSTLWIAGWSYLPAGHRFATLYESLLAGGLALAAIRCFYRGAWWKAESSLRRAAGLAALLCLCFSAALAVKSIQSLLYWQEAKTNPYYLAAVWPLEWSLVAIGFGLLTRRSIGRCFIALLPATCVITELYGTWWRMPRFYGDTSSALEGLHRMPLLRPALLGTPTLIAATTLYLLLASILLTLLLIPAKEPVA